MKVREAVVIRIKELCKKKHLKINGLAHHAGVPASTLKNIIKGKYKKI